MTFLIFRELIDSSQLSYAGGEEVEDLVRLVTNNDSASDSQCVCNETPTLKNKPKSYGKDKSKTIGRLSFSSSENIINIQISYDVSQAIEPDIWDSNFHSVSLYGLIEYLVLDIKNIYVT